MSAADINDARTILEWARHFENSEEFFKAVELANFSSDAKRSKLNAFKAGLKKANNGSEVADAELFDFLRHFHLLGYDLDIKAGVTLALLHSLIGQYSPNDAQSVWAKLVNEVEFANQNAGTISAASIPENLLSAFRQRRVETIPGELAIPRTPKPPGGWAKPAHAAALTAAALLGKWNENNESDLELIRRLLGGF